MPNHARFHPLADLRRGLEAARLEGVGFEEACERAWAVTGWPRDTLMRRWWKDAVSATREAWRASYEGRETSESRHVGALMARLDPESAAGEDPRGPRLLA